MIGMADKSAGDRRPRRRIKTLTQAAMNADVTVNQLEGVLGGLGDTLGDLDDSLTNLNSAIGRLDDGLEHVESTLERIDYIVGVGETVMSPLSVTEHAVHNAFNALRNRGSR